MLEPVAYLTPEQLVAAPSLLDRARTVARPGFNRWLVPPAAVSAGQGYGIGLGGLSAGVTAEWSCVLLPMG